MDWRTYYKECLMSADEAVKLIKDSDGQKRSQL